ncbi:malate dehydrogenase [Brevibacterium album]|uniref:malate dehydrogenase n=1 Tax=Brevibacterium album TaxID=417948 RepID=UPI0003FC7E7C|nr:malate dehydrogenase [Brevibacterium album]
MTRTIAVTGAAGSIAYSLLFRLAAEASAEGERIRLRLLEIPAAVERLEGVRMELEDCAFPALEEIAYTADPEEAFAGVDAAFLVGSAPRRPGMDRADLLEANGRIFAEQGRALGAGAQPDARVVVVGNPANTNALIAAEHAQRAPRTDGGVLSADRFTALTRLDHNRALAQLAARTGASVESIERLAIWGNHSNTQFPDLGGAAVAGEPAMQVLARVCGGPDAAEAWVAGDFIPTVAGRGGAVIEARGASSAASAASAALDHLRDWTHGTRGRWVSMAVRSHGEYGVPAGLISSFPCVVDADGSARIVEGLELTGEQRSRIDASAAELEEERQTADHLGFL